MAKVSSSNPPSSSISVLSLSLICWSFVLPLYLYLSLSFSRRPIHSGSSTENAIQSIIKIGPESIIQSPIHHPMHPLLPLPLLLLLLPPLVSFNPIVLQTQPQLLLLITGDLVKLFYQTFLDQYLLYKKYRAHRMRPVRMMVYYLWMKRLNWSMGSYSHWGTWLGNWVVGESQQRRREKELALSTLENHDKERLERRHFRKESSSVLYFITFLSEARFWFIADFCFSWAYPFDLGSSQTDTLNHVSLSFFFQNPSDMITSIPIQHRPTPYLIS